MKAICPVCAHVFEDELAVCPKCGSERAVRLCVRCKGETPVPELYPETAMQWPTGVDYIDSPEPANTSLWLCHACEDCPEVTLYWPAFGFMSDELASLTARYDRDFLSKHGIRNAGWLN